MVGCGCQLAGVESGFVFEGRLKRTFPKDFWGIHTEDERYKCGLENESDNYVYNNPGDHILCVDCLKKKGYIW